MGNLEGSFYFPRFLKRCFNKHIFVVNLFIHLISCRHYQTELISKIFIKSHVDYF